MSGNGGGAPRALFLNPSVFAIGGMQAWLASLLPDLRGRGWEVGLALPDDAWGAVESYLAHYPFDPCVRVRNLTGTRLGCVLAVQDALASFRPDVLVVANVVAAYRAVQDLRARRRPAPRLVACVHTLDPGIFADLSRLEPVLDALVAPNRLIARAGAAISGLSPERVFYAPYRVERPPLPPLAAQDGPLRLVFAHRLDHEQKRALDLPPLVAGLARRGLDFRLDIAGAGPEAAALEQALRPEVASGRVRFLGVVPPAELERLLQPGSVLLVLSQWEMGPLVAWQAMARGVVVASSRYLGSGLEGFLRDGDNALLFPVGDTERAAESIVRLAEPELRARISRRAWVAVGEHFSSEASTGAWDVALRRALELPPLPAPPDLPRIAPAGRLDRVAGVRLAERIRRLVRRPARVAGAGDVWHLTEGGGLARSELMARLSLLDGAESGAGG